MTTPRNLMMELAEKAYLFSNWHHYKNIPIGGVILSLSSEKREILRELKSDDLRNIRIWEELKL